MPSPDLPSATGDNTYASYTLDHHGLVAGMVDELGLVEKIDAIIPQDLQQFSLWLHCRHSGMDAGIQCHGR
ncbi:MAG: DUF4277 domain-containing protein [Proteobacteria bacterium]|nr:DUF4277 domain-containing protein [Pseudomonadota bacterium]